MYKKLAFISILTLSSLSQAQEFSEHLYKNHQITLTKQEIKYLLFFPYIKETVIAQVNINGENGESKMKTKWEANEGISYQLTYNGN